MPHGGFAAYCECGFGCGLSVRVGPRSKRLARPGSTAGQTRKKRIRDAMPEVMFAGPDGRLEGRYHHSKERGAPVALVLASAPAARRDDEQSHHLCDVSGVPAARLLGDAVQFPRRRAQPGPLRRRHRRDRRRRGGARLDAGGQPELGWICGSPAIRSARSSACRC